MSTPNRGITGIFDPRLRTKDFAPSEPSTEGQFAGAAMSVIRDENTLLFGSGSGDRNIEFWKTPSDTSAVYIIEGATLELLDNATQAGTPVDMEVSIEIERTSGHWYTLLRARLVAANFVSNVYDVDKAPAVFGMQGANMTGVALGREKWVENPLVQFDGRVVVVADAGTDVFTTDTEYGHGLADGDEVHITVGAGGVVPGGFSIDTGYFVRDRTHTTFKLAATLGGAAIDVTSNGTYPAYVFPLERGVALSQRGIYVGQVATRFRGSKVRLRGRTVSGSNAWTLQALAAIQLRMVR